MKLNYSNLEWKVIPKPSGSLNIGRVGSPYAAMFQELTDKAATLEGNEVVAIKD